MRAKAREALELGKLPYRKPDGTWGGRGTGAQCSVCDLPVAPEQMEFEIEFAHNGDNPSLDKFHVHIECFSALEFERRRKADSDAVAS